MPSACIVLMGSGAETAHATAEYLAAAGEKVGVVKVHLFRPFSVQHLLAALPPTVKAIAVLDRTKEPGSAGEPLYLDVVSRPQRGRWQVGRWPSPVVIGGRYGLCSKEFTPAMVAGSLRRAAPSRSRSTTSPSASPTTSAHTSLEYDPSFAIERR